MRKIVMTGLVAAAALLGCAGPALAGTGGTGTATPASRVAASHLGALAAALPRASASTASFTTGIRISCASPTACLTVGVHEASSSSSGTISPFAARLHAGSWKAVPVKAPKGSPYTILLDVSCKSATYCLAVGDTAAKTAGFAGYALTWNGSTLTPIAAPPMPAHTDGLVTAVSCVAVKSCVVLGYGFSQTTNATSTIIWTWNGAKWARTTVPSASPTTVSQYGDLHCFSLKSCVAVGAVTDSTGAGTGGGTPVAAAWNGTTLTNLHAPLPTGISQAAFNGVSCVSAHSCAVVGSGAPSSTSSNTLAFAEVWNGKTWAVTKWSGPKGDTAAELIDVSCTSAVRCIAVGGHGTAKTGGPAALAWNGRKWTVLKVAGAGAGKTAVFEGISCPVNGKCVTTGAIGKADGSTGTAIAGYWNGSTWKYGPMLAAA